MTPDVIYRPAGREDVPFIITSWVISNKRGGSPLARYVEQGLYRKEHEPIIEALLARAGATVVCPKEVPSEIIGWICAERLDGKLVVHYCLVKKLYKRMGFARRLLEHCGHKEGEPVIATHITELYTKRRYGNLTIINNPYLLRTIGQ